jgi:hypothetical protein
MICPRCKGEAEGKLVAEEVIADKAGQKADFVVRNIQVTCPDCGTFPHREVVTKAEGPVM